MNLKDTAQSLRASNIIELLKKSYPEAKIALHYTTPFQLLVATILSAQCTDVRVNQVTPVLFEAFPDARTMSEASLEAIESIIKPTGFFHNKAKNIRRCAEIILAEHNGEVPATMEALLRLPGVARKTANIVLYNAYQIVSGIPVDTHVKRLSNRLGLTTQHDPEKIERDLMALIAQEDWGKVSYLLIEHGRAVCNARKPRCGECVLREFCPFQK